MKKYNTNGRKEKRNISVIKDADGNKIVMITILGLKVKDELTGMM